MENKKETPVYIKVLNIFGIASTVLAILYGIYIMIHHLGLIDSLDFGAGAYYYADMPGFENLVNASHYTSQTPTWVFILLFLAWGYLMYRFWVWIDKKFS